MSGPVGVFPVVLATAVKVLIRCHPPPKIMTFHKGSGFPASMEKWAVLASLGHAAGVVLPPGTLGGAWGHLWLS